jgi:VIT1/CCC1 family predicted Fe2+/Mn2+ transporter
MTDTTPQTAGNTAGAEPASARTLAGRVRRSFIDSSGSIVFGMEDGTVSIFGLVFGVAAAAPDSSAVLLAGATGAISAAVSMMAGTFLDVQTANDQAASRSAEERARYAADPRQADQDVRRRLVSAGFSDAEAATLTGIMDKHPETRLEIAAAVDLGAGEAARQTPMSSRRGCSSPTCSPRRYRSCRSPSSAWGPRGSSRWP